MIWAEIFEEKFFFSSSSFFLSVARSMNDDVLFQRTSITNEKVKKCAVIIQTSPRNLILCLSQQIEISTETQKFLRQQKCFLS